MLYISSYLLLTIVIPFRFRIFSMWMTNKRRDKLEENKELYAVKQKYIDLYQIRVADLMGDVKRSGLYSDSELLKVVSDKYYDIEDDE